MPRAPAIPPDRVRCPQDLALAHRARSGSTADRRELARRLQCVPRILAVLNRRLGRPFGREDLEDAAQDVAAAVWRRLDSYTGQSRLESWAFGFCSNVLSDRLRALRRRPVHVEHREDDGTDVAPSSGNEEAVVAVHDVLARVGADEGVDVVRLRHFEGLDYEQLGAHYGITPNAAKKRYYRGLARLRTALAPFVRGGLR